MRNSTYSLTTAAAGWFAPSGPRGKRKNLSSYQMMQSRSLRQGGSHGLTQQSSGTGKSTLHGLGVVGGVGSVIIFSWLFFGLCHEGTWRSVFSLTVGLEGQAAVLGVATDFSQVSIWLWSTAPAFCITGRPLKKTMKLGMPRTLYRAASSG